MLDFNSIIIKAIAVISLVMAGKLRDRNCQQFQQGLCFFSFFFLIVVLILTCAPAACVKGDLERYDTGSGVGRNYSQVEDTLVTSFLPFQ